MRSRGLLLAAVAVALGLGGIFFVRSQQGGTNIGQVAKKFNQEPRITVFLAREEKTRQMPIEEYIMGVVAGEMKEGWPVEAYAAQAILARSFTLDFISRGSSKREGVDISTEFEEAQAYNPSKITDAIREAVRMTRGKVITHNGRYIRAFFHAYSGGETATAKEGLNLAGAEPPYIKSVKLPENRFVPEEFKRWRAEIPLETIAEKLAERGVRGRVTDVRIGAKGPSGRVTEFVVIHDGGQTAIPGNDFRVALDPMVLKSTLIRSLRVENGRLVAEGTGFGHGVGLSQWDTLMFARQGKSPQEIVKFFFRDVNVQKLWD